MLIERRLGISEIQPVAKKHEKRSVKRRLAKRSAPEHRGWAVEERFFALLEERAQRQSQKQQPKA
jgi:hypothetical protein